MDEMDEQLRRGPSPVPTPLACHEDPTHVLPRAGWAPAAGPPPQVWRVPHTDAAAPPGATGEQRTADLVALLRADAAPPDRGSGRHRARHGWVRTAGSTVVGLCLAATLWGAGVRMWDNASAQREASGSPAAATPSPSRVALTVPSPRATADGGAWGSVRPTAGVVRALARERAAAWEAGAPEDLTRVLAPGSPALARDVADLRDAAHAGVTYRRVRFVLDEVALIAGAPHDDVVRVRARVAEATVEAVRNGRAVRPAETTPGGPVVIELERDEEAPHGWLIRSFGPA